MNAEGQSKMYVISESTRLLRLRMMEQSFDTQNRINAAYPRKYYGIPKIKRREFKHPADCVVIIVGEMPE